MAFLNILSINSPPLSLSFCIDLHSQLMPTSSRLYLLLYTTVSYDSHL